MAIYHLSVKPVARSAGRSATAAAAYRAGSRIECEREGRLHDYSRKQGIAHSEIIVPDGALWASDRSALWNAAEAAERRVNSTVAREYELALPAELSARGRVALVRAFGGELRDRYGVAADIAIHAPHHAGDQRNWHAHVLTTTRTVEAEGLGAKTRILDDRKTGPAQVVELRAAWAALSNRFLEQEGFSERVDYRSLEAIRDGCREEGRAHVEAGRVEAAKDAFAAAYEADRPAQVHMGPAASAMERRAAREARVEGRAYEPETRIGAEVLRARQFAAATRDYLRSWTHYARTRIERAGARLEAAFVRIKERFREQGFGRASETGGRPEPSSPSEGRSFLERRSDDAQPPAPDRPQESFLERRASAPARDNPAGRNADAMDAARARMADTLSRISEHLPDGLEKAAFEKEARALLEKAEDATQAQRQLEQAKSAETPAPSKALSAAERQHQIDIENRDRIERELRQRDRSEGQER
ncbi:MAG: MobQ family relaxase [Methylocystis silviterrae]